MKKNSDFGCWSKYSGAPEDWDDHIASLGGSFYQSYGWGEVRKTAGWHPLRMIAVEDGKVVAACGSLIKRVGPITMCWVPDGPVGNINFFCTQFRKALVHFSNAKLLYCRINVLRISSDFSLKFLVKHEWARPRVLMGGELSILYSLGDGKQERLQKASGNWRHNLKRSGRHGLIVERWLLPDAAEISNLYREMEALKSLPIQHDHTEIESIFSDCRERVIVFRCLNSKGKLLAVRAAGFCGSRAMDLLAVAGAEARKVYASHATLWALLSYCEDIGINEYDLSGVDPVRNKGVYDFKHGTGGILTTYIGEWEWASAPGLSLIVNFYIWIKKQFAK